MPEIRRSTASATCTTLFAVAILIGGIAGCRTVLDRVDENSQVPSAELGVTFRQYHSIEDRYVARRSEPVPPMAARGFHALGQIESVWRLDDRPIPKRYLNSLNQDISSFDHVLRHPDNSEFSANLLSVTVRSLEIKADRAATFPRTWPDLIDVTVNTVRKGKGVNDLVISYCARGWKDISPHWRRFKQLSTPATERIAPSVYIFQAGTVQTDPIDIGSDGSAKAAITIEIP